MRQNSLWQRSFVPFLSLFTSMGTLVCCALPALLVTLGMGATLAGLVSAAPWLVALSEYKIALFAIAGVMLIIAAIFQYRSRFEACPADPKQAKACAQARRMSLIILVVSVVIYLIGFFFAFIAAYFV